MRYLFTLALIGIVGACTTPGYKPVTEEEIAKADCGKELTAVEFNKIAKTYLADHLIDPDSLRYEGSTTPSRGFGRTYEGEVIYGYFACYDFNAKNRMGGYSGKSRECMLIRNGKVIQNYKVHENGRDVTPRLGTIS